MPMWRCPHCATPQAETARCWVCHRSSTACGACRHFRRAVAGQLGYCGLDRRREPLRGDEIRPCWEATDASGSSVTALPGIGSFSPLEPREDGTAVRSIQFVEVQPTPRRDGRSGRDGGTGGATYAGGTDPIATLSVTSAEPRWSLWDEPEA